MRLLIAYVMLALAGNVVTYFVGLAVERVVPAASLPVFLILFFAVLWAAWIVAVRLTASKTEPSAAS